MIAFARQRHHEARGFSDHVEMMYRQELVRAIPVNNLLCLGLSPTGAVLVAAVVGREPTQSAITALRNEHIVAHILVPWVVLQVAINNSATCVAMIITMQNTEVVVAYSTKRDKILTIFTGAAPNIKTLRFMTDNCLLIDRSVVYIDVY